MTTTERVFFANKASEAWRELQRISYDIALTMEPKCGCDALCKALETDMGYRLALNTWSAYDDICTEFHIEYFDQVAIEYSQMAFARVYNR